jgi:hypothetical protein
VSDVSEQCPNHGLYSYPGLGNECPNCARVQSWELATGDLVNDDVFFVDLKPGDDE